MPTRDFTEIAGAWTDAGQPVIEGALAWMTCGLHALLPMGDHTLAIGRVTGTSVADEKRPLVYWSRGYRAISP
ncbi:MAG: flavin reductase family protein [Myxococcota bacterium]